MKATNHKYRAFVKFCFAKNGKMEFSNSLLRLESLIHSSDVKQVTIYEAKSKRKLITLTRKLYV